MLLWYPRAKLINQDDAMLKLNWYKINYIKSLLQEKLKVQESRQKKQKVQAWEHHLLMNVSANLCDVLCLSVSYCVLNCSIRHYHSS